MRKFFSCMAAVIIASYVVFFIFLNASSIAPPGTTAAKVTLGTVSDTPYQGFFWRMPFVSDVVLINTRQQTQEYTISQLKTQDLQTIGLECAVIYQINSQKVPDIVRNLDVESIEAEVLSPRLANGLQETVVLWCYVLALMCYPKIFLNVRAISR